MRRVCVLVSNLYVTIWENIPWMPNRYRLVKDFDLLKGTIYNILFIRPQEKQTLLCTELVV